MDTTIDMALEVGLQSRDALPVQLLGYAAVHDAVMRDLDRLEAVAAGVAGAAGSSHAEVELPALSHWWECFERCIIHHHEREDDLVFPLLVERGTPVDPVLTEDHHELDHLMAAVRRRLAEPNGRDGSVADPAALAASARALRDHMADHLAREEAVVFPAYAALSSDDVAVVERGMRRGMTLRDMAFMAPWMLDSAHPRVGAQVWSDAPPPLRLLYRLFWRRSYSVEAAPVLGVAR